MPVSSSAPATSSWTVRWPLGTGAVSGWGSTAGPGPLTDLKVLAADGSPELSTPDVDGRWVRDTFDESPAPARPLSRVVPTPYLWGGVPAGERSFEVVVPTVRDGLEEPEESLRLRLITYDEGSWEPREGPVFTGTVRDAP
ncbi:hypothetical protein ACF07T_15505 [Streptomyces sp. NPDC015184]|uniref:hypothetical protein n=1 Tax=Streptomyces sp. NPDC015184 TaxID=3364946 RepID=UPI0036F977D8